MYGKLSSLAFEATLGKAHLHQRSGLPEVSHSKDIAARFLASRPKKTGVNALGTLERLRDLNLVTDGDVEADRLHAFLFELKSGRLGRVAGETSQSVFSVALE